jgi:O-antigen ligase
MRPRSVNNVLNWLVVVLAFSLPLYRAWVSLAAALILLLWFFQHQLEDRAAKLGRHPLTLAILFFLALNLLSLLWSEDPAGGFEYWRKYLYLLLAPAIASSLRPGFARRALIAFLAATALSVAMMPVVIIGNLHIRHVHPGNPAATMSHLDYSLVLAVAAVLILVHLSHTVMRRRQRVLWILLFVVVIGGLLLNIGRSGQFAFVATLAVLGPYLLRRRSWTTRVAVLASVATALLVAYFAVTPFRERVENAVVELRDAVVEHRIDTNQGKRVAAMVVALDIVESDPVLGTGIGGNMPEFRRLLETDYPQFRDAIGWYPHLHNQYIQVTTELGLVGLIALLTIFGTLVTGKVRNIEFQSAAVAVGSVYFFGCFADPFLHKQLPLALFALAAGVISSEDEVFAAEESTDSSKADR